VPPFLPLVRKARSVVLDAGGLVPDLLDAAIDGGGRVVATPHAAEFRRVAGVGGGKYSVRSFATRQGVTLLYKGNPTLVTDGGPPVLITTGGPELATIGTGDVLSGMIAAVWARGAEPTTAAISAAYWHGVAGHALAQEGTVTAEALTEHIGRFAW
jgi:NAD(P)H-hydrate epimerase